jgi:hypothetical protein
MGYRAPSRLRNPFDYVIQDYAILKITQFSRLRNSQDYAILKITQFSRLRNPRFRNSQDYVIPSTKFGRLDGAPPK